MSEPFHVLEVRLAVVDGVLDGAQCAFESADADRPVRFSDRAGDGVLVRVYSTPELDHHLHLPVVQLRVVRAQVAQRRQAELPVFGRVVEGAVVAQHSHEQPPAVPRPPFLRMVSTFFRWRPKVGGCASLMRRRCPVRNDCSAQVFCIGLRRRPRTDRRGACADSNAGAECRAGNRGEAGRRQSWSEVRGLFQVPAHAVPALGKLPTADRKATSHRSTRTGGPS